MSTYRRASLSIEKLWRLMRYLGARDAINLNGGSPIAMVVRNQAITYPL